MIVKLLTEHHLQFLSLKGGCRGSSESTHVKMPHCWKSRALAQSYPSQHTGLILIAYAHNPILIYTEVLIFTDWSESLSTPMLRVYEQ